MPLNHHAATEAATGAIASFGWLAACPENFRGWVLASLHWRAFSAGQTVTHAGDEDSGLCCIGAGQLLFQTSFAMPDIGTAFFGLPGSWFGHAPLLGLPVVGSTIARMDSLVGFLRLSALRARLAAHPQEWELISLGQSDLFIQAAGAHADLLMPDTRRRLAATLLRLGGHRHRRYPVCVPERFVCTQEELAGTASLTRNTAGKFLREFQDEGLVGFSYGQIAILQPGRLKAIADDS